ncbi:MAG: cytidylate kinase-like family protein [Clostridia bacterium]
MNTVITISRSFSSGGREIAKRLADELNFAYYDRELIDAISEETGLSKDYVEQFSESNISRVFPIHIAQTFIMPVTMPSDSLQITQTNIIKRVAEKGNCVIVGRRADYILREKNALKVFIYASDMDERIERCYKKVPTDRVKSPKEITKEIQKVDKTRAKYYNYYTDQNWGSMQNYNLCIDTSVIDIKKAVEIIIAALNI